MSHLHRAELLRWRDAGEEADRPRVLEHLAGCAECRRGYAALVREAVAEEPPEDLVQAALPVGLAAYGAGARPPRRPRWTVWAASGLAALLIALAAFVLVRRAIEAPADDAARGEAIQLLEPVGTVRAPVVFRWSSPVRAARYRLWVHDQAGAVVMSTLTGEERAEPAAGELAPGATFRWQVDAYDAQATVLARSPAQEFTVAR